MQDSISKYTHNIQLAMNADQLYSQSLSNQFMLSGYTLNQTPIDKINYQDILNKPSSSSNNTIIPSNDADSLSMKLNTKVQQDMISFNSKDGNNKLSAITQNANNSNELLIQKLGMMEIQNKEQEERIINLQKLNDQLMSAITDLNGNDSAKQKYQKDKNILQQQHEKEVNDYTSQIKDIKNKLELQKAQMNEKISELEKDKLLLEKQLEGEEKNYQKKLQQYKEEKDSINQILKDYESIRQKNQEAMQITLENKIKVLEEVIEKQKSEAEERSGQMANYTEKNILNMKQIHDNEKNILMSKISALQGEKKIIEQQSEYNFKLFTELRNKSENQQDGLYNDMDKLRKKVNGLEQKIIEKESIIIIQQQKIDGNDTILRLKEKNYEDSLKALKVQNEQLQQNIQNASLFYYNHYKIQTTLFIFNLHFIYNFNLLLYIIQYKNCSFQVFQSYLLVDQFLIQIEIREQMKKQQNELKSMQFMMQEKQFEMTDQQKLLKKQIFNEKKKAEQMQDAANRIKDDYTKKNSFVIQELLMKEEKIKKLNNQISKQSSSLSMQNQIGQFNQNNNNTSYSFINNTNLSNMMQNPNLSNVIQNPNQSILQQNSSNSANQSRPSYRQKERNQTFTSNTIINQDNFNSSDNLNNVNSQYASKSPKLLQISQMNSGSVMSGSQIQDSYSVPHSNRSRTNGQSYQCQKTCITPSSSEHLFSSNPNFMNQPQQQNQPRSATIYHNRSANAYHNEDSTISTQINPNTTITTNGQKKFIIDHHAFENFDYKSQIIGNLLSINSPSNLTVPQMSNEFMSPQSQKHDLSRNELQSMRGLTPTNPSNTIIADKKQQETMQKNKRSMSQAVSGLGACQSNGNSQLLPQNQKTNTVSKQVNQNKSVSHYPLQVQQKEITGNNLTLITHDASNNKTPTQNKHIAKDSNFKKNIQGTLSVQTAYNSNTLNNRSISPNQQQQQQQNITTTTTTPANQNSQRDEKAKQIIKNRNISVDQNKKSNSKIVGVTLNSYRENNQNESNPIKNLSVSATPLSCVSLNLLNIQNESNGISQDNSIAKYQSQQQQYQQFTTPNAIKNQNNNNFASQGVLSQNSFMQENNQQSRDKSEQKHQSVNQQQGKRDITFGTPINTDNNYSEMSQKVQRSQDEHIYSQLALNQDTQIPLQSKIKNILTQLNYDVNQLQNTKQDSVISHHSYNYNNNTRNNNINNNFNINANNNMMQQKEIEEIFFEQMREAIQTYPEIADERNLRQSLENKDFDLALYGLKDVIQKIKINDHEKRDLQIEITTLQSKCSLEKASVQNNPSLMQNNNSHQLDTQNNYHTTSHADSKINQMILDNIQAKTIETCTAINFTQEKENIKQLPLSLEMNNKFKPLTLNNMKGNSNNVNNLSLNLNGLKSPQFTQLRDENKHPQGNHINFELINDYKSNVENYPHNQQINGNTPFNHENNIKNSKLNDRQYHNQSQSQVNSARVSSKSNAQEQSNYTSSKNQYENENNNNNKLGKHASSISIKIQNNADQSPTMYMVNGGLNHKRNVHSMINGNQIQNYPNNQIHNTNKCSTPNDKSSSSQNQNCSYVLQNKSIISNNALDSQNSNSQRNIGAKNNNLNAPPTRKVNPLKDIIQY